MPPPPTCASNSLRISLVSDNLFTDGVSLQLTAVIANVIEGFVAILKGGIAV